MDILVLVFTISMTVICVSSKGSLSTEVLTFSLQATTDIMVFFSTSLRMLSEFENMMTSFQRINQYIELESEDDLKKPIDDTLALEDKSLTWPKEGKI